MTVPIVDVNTFIGEYPFRHIPHPDPAALLGVMEREGIDHCITGYLPAPWQRSPLEANNELFRRLESFRETLSPAPVVNHCWPAWEMELRRAASEQSAAVRAYPVHWSGGVTRAASSASDFAGACAELQLPLILTTRFEDLRQRSGLDVAPDLSAAAVREMVRAHDSVRIVLCAAGRSLIEEVHWSLTPGERDRIWYDISWVWGPPSHDLAHLLDTVGAQRFLFGSQWPLRLVQAPLANLELVPAPVAPASLGDPRRVFPRLGRHQLT